MPAGRVDEAELTRVTAQAMVVNPRAEVYPLNSNGQVIGHRSPTPLAHQRVDLAPVRAFLGVKAPYPIYGRDPRAHTVSRVFSVAEVRTGTALHGSVYVLLACAGSQELVATVAGSHILRAAAGTLAIVFLLAIIAA